MEEGKNMRYLKEERSVEGEETKVNEKNGEGVEEKGLDLKVMQRK